MAKVAFPFIGTFLLSSVHLGGLFVLSVDYLGKAAWYWWLFQQSTLGRAQLRCISCYLSVLALLLFVVAIIGMLGETWILALEVITIIPTLPTVLTLGRPNWSLPWYLLCSWPSEPRRCNFRYSANESRHVEAMGKVTQARLLDQYGFPHTCEEIRQGDSRTIRNPAFSLARANYIFCELGTFTVGYLLLEIA